MKYRNIVNNCLVTLLTLIIFFLVGEFAVRLYLFHNTVYDIEMTRYAIGIKTNSDNPLIGHVQKPNSVARLMGVSVETNSDGFRDKEYPLLKGGKYRIIVLGDSLAFGWGVEQEDTFENILETELNKTRPTEIINFGAGNYNTEQEVNLFLEKGLKYRPDKVVVFYFINDAEIAQKKSRLWFLGHSRLITFYWSRIHTFINNLFSTKSFRAYYADLYQENQKGWIRTRKAFLLLKKVCRENDIELQVVLLPELHNLENYPFKKEHKMVSTFLESNNISSLDLTPFFKNNENPMQLWVAGDDAHPNKSAHRLIAEYTLNFIAKKERMKE